MPVPYSEKQFKRALGMVLRALRRERDLSQEEAAARAKLDRSHLSDLENGDHDPRAYKLAKLAAVYAVPVGELLQRIEARSLTLAGAKRGKNGEL